MKLDLLGVLVEQGVAQDGVHMTLVAGVLLGVVLLMTLGGAVPVRRTLLHNHRTLRVAKRPVERGRRRVEVGDWVNGRLVRRLEGFLFLFLVRRGLCGGLVGGFWGSVTVSTARPAQGFACRGPVAVLRV